MYFVKKRVVLYVLSWVLAVSANTNPQCNPLLPKQGPCPPVPALSQTIIEEFSENTGDWSIYSTPNNVVFTDEGLCLTMDGMYQNPGIQSNFYIMFGKVEVTLRAAGGRGIISSFYLQSDSLDEIDFEWFGGDPYEVQSNYFSKGNVTTYERGGYHAVRSPQEEFHTYTIDWTEEKLTWFVDFQPVRSLMNTSNEGYPQTPMRLFTGIWAGGDISNSPGTIDWAGGVVDYDDLPQSMVIEKAVVTDYSSGSMYRYTDKSGDWQSVEAIDGEINGRKQEAVVEFERLLNGEQLHRINRRNYSEEMENVDRMFKEGPVSDTPDSKETSPIQRNASGSLSAKGSLKLMILSFFLFTIISDFF